MRLPRDQCGVLKILGAIQGGGGGGRIKGIAWSAAVLIIRIRTPTSILLHCMVS